MKPVDKGFAGIAATSVMHPPTPEGVIIGRRRRQIAAGPFPDLRLRCGLKSAGQYPVALIFERANVDAATVAAHKVGSTLIEIQKLSAEHGQPDFAGAQCRAACNRAALRTSALDQRSA
jgi:hypothetical protein